MHSLIVDIEEMKAARATTEKSNIPSTSNVVVNILTKSDKPSQSQSQLKSAKIEQSKLSQSMITPTSIPPKPKPISIVSKSKSIEMPR